ncbi:hypothetical protein CG716_04930 [Mycolicibacterium sphagni]|uniref:Uncharacterized protein n=2 Tax=Mycolicibacterium sphagni TaxID=1786 RepID=A0A255DR92_9MYCO|nr:hypothetical protein CG716_04930 [Mycolicibacterium sphagni]
MNSNTTAVLDGSIPSDSDDSPVVLFSEGGEMRKFQDVISEMRRVAFHNPLGRNTAPEYTEDDGEPCCFVGHALKRMGISPNFKLNDYTASALPWELWGIERPNSYQQLWITTVQSAADNGNAWIISIATADALLI